MRAAKQSGGVRSRLRWTTLYALLLAAYSVFALLDAFEIAGNSSPYQEILGWAGIALVLIGAASTARTAVRERQGWL